MIKKTTSTGVEVAPNVTTGSCALISLSSTESSKRSFLFGGADFLESEERFFFSFVLGRTGAS